MQGANPGMLSINYPHHDARNVTHIFKTVFVVRLDRRWRFEARRYSHVWLPTTDNKASLYGAAS